MTLLRSFLPSVLLILGVYATSIAARPGPQVLAASIGGGLITMAVNMLQDHR